MQIDAAIAAIAAIDAILGFLLSEHISGVSPVIFVNFAIKRLHLHWLQMLATRHQAVPLTLVAMLATCIGL